MQSLPISIYPIDSKPYGYSYGEWGARWWQWLFSIPRSKNPAFDPDGSNSNINQNNRNVFFLCQTYQERIYSIPNRTVTIPTQRSIFMPIINWVSVLHVDGETDNELAKVAKQRMDIVSNLEITINGRTIRDGLEGYRAQSPVFEIALPEDNIISLPPGITRAVSDGYWLFIKPLNNDIKLSSFGSCSSGLTKIGVNYMCTTDR